MFQYNDRIIITLTSGSGGKGCLSFYRTKKNPRGGPDGGDGGKGGAITFKSSTQVRDLEHFKGIKKLVAQSGEPGDKQKKSGRNGKDLTVSIPVGTVVRNEKEEILFDFKQSETKEFLAGGRGAKGNAFFKSSRNQAPKQTQKGEKGQTQKVILEFKPLVDVALIGEVNSGKSTFFNKVTNADSKVGDYPYTTLIPYLGKMDFKNANVFLMDVPGLEAGAHKRVSQGLGFLRSIQRAKILLHFIVSNHFDPIESKNKIEKEIKKFDEKNKDSLFTPLSKKKRFIVLSCADTVTGEQIEELTKKMKQDVFVISSHNNQGVKELMMAIEKAIR